MKQLQHDLERRMQEGGGRRFAGRAPVTLIEASEAEGEGLATIIMHCDLKSKDLLSSGTAGCSTIRVLTRDEQEDRSSSLLRRARLLGRGTLMRIQGLTTLSALVAFGGGCGKILGFEHSENVECLQDSDCDEGTCQHWKCVISSGGGRGSSCGGFVGSSGGNGGHNGGGVGGAG